MKISIRRSGGFIPLPVTAEVDTSRLSDGDAAKAHALVKAIDNAPQLHTGEPDSSVYHITADDRQLSTVEGTPGGTAAAQLLNLVTQFGAQKEADSS